MGGSNNTVHLNVWHRKLENINIAEIIDVKAIVALIYVNKDPLNVQIIVEI